MTSKDLKTINIKGKEYVQVSERILYFNANYPQGSITTELVSAVDSDNIVIKATVYPDIDLRRSFTGYSQATKGEGYINKTSALENAETSAVGRALGMMGIGVIDGIASADEINKSGISDLKAKEDIKKQLDKDKICTNPDCENKQFEVPEKVADFSKSKYGRVLCYRCQQEENKKGAV